MNNSYIETNMKFILGYSNDMTHMSYMEGYELLTKISNDVNESIDIIIASLESVDDSYVPMMINQTLVRLLVMELSDRGIIVVDDILLHSIVEVYKLSDEIMGSPDTASILLDVGSDIDMELLVHRLGLDDSLLMNIESTEEFISLIYETSLSASVMMNERDINEQRIISATPEQG